MNLFLNFVHQSLVTLLDRPHIRPHAAEVLDQPTDIHSLGGTHWRYLFSGGLLRRTLEFSELGR